MALWGEQLVDNAMLCNVSINQHIVWTCIVMRIISIIIIIQNGFISLAGGSLMLKVVGKAQVTKSILHNFWYRCLVVALIYGSEVLAQTLHECMTYERKEKLKFMWSSKYNWLIDGPNCNWCSGKRYGCGQLEAYFRGSPYASKREVHGKWVSTWSTLLVQRKW